MAKRVMVFRVVVSVEYGRHEVNKNAGEAEGYADGLLENLAPMLPEVEVLSVELQESHDHHRTGRE